MVDQWNGIENQETDRHEYNQLQFPTDGVETAGHPYGKKKESEHRFYTFRKINSNWTVLPKYKT